MHRRQKTLFWADHGFINTKRSHRHTINVLDGRIKGKEVRVPAVSTPFERSEIHFADAIHYSEFAEDGELSLKEDPGIISTRWEDLIKEDAEKSSERVSNRHEAR